MRALLLFVVGWAAAAEPPAFPGAEGAGATSRGGRGGAVVFVTTLADYRPGEATIPGSLRAACEQAGPRTIVFRCAGRIELQAPLVISEPRVTIAGQTAPGDGICLSGYGVSIRSSDVIVRHLRCRPGDAVGRMQQEPWNTDALSVTAPSRRVIIDHCSTSWANDEVLSVSGADIDDVTVQWCIIAESLNKSTHHKGEHGFGSLIRSNGAISFHHNLYACHKSRTPRPGTYGEGSILFDFRNNVVHRGHGYTAQDPVRMNFVGNHYSAARFSATDTCTVFLADNVCTFTGGQRVAQAFRTAPVHTTDAIEARAAVLAAAGATLPRRDAVDTRVIALVTAGTGALIDSETDVGGWPSYAAADPPDDRDQDAMPDSWEQRYGLDPDQPNHQADQDGDGYTDLEEWLNDSDPTRAEVVAGP